MEVRYRPTDERAYLAAARNLQVTEGSAILPDDHCVAGKPVQKPGTKRRGGGGSSTKSTPRKGVTGQPHRSEPDGNEVLVYADGACSGNPGPAGLGVVMRFDDQCWELSEYLGEGTNNIAELTAILRAARAVEDKERPVRIHTDSNYSIGVLVRGWKAKANRELVAEVKQALAQLDDYDLIHVPGHAGVALNERADELARQAVEARHTSDWSRVVGDGRVGTLPSPPHKG